MNGRYSNLASFYIVPARAQFLLHLFLIYISDLSQAVNFCKVHHFADNTNLLHLNKSIAKLNKFVSCCQLS